jgi:hypothetical protein
MANKKRKHKRTPKKTRPKKKRQSDIVRGLSKDDSEDVVAMQARSISGTF